MVFEHAQSACYVFRYIKLQQFNVAKNAVCSSTYMYNTDNNKIKSTYLFTNEHYTVMI